MFISAAIGTIAFVPFSAVYADEGSMPASNIASTMFVEPRATFITKNKTITSVSGISLYVTYQVNDTYGTISNIDGVSVSSVPGNISRVTYTSRNLGSYCLFTLTYYNHSTTSYGSELVYLYP